MLRWNETPALTSMRCTRAWVEINLEALAHNTRSIKSLLGAQTQLMSVVKADAYGHGALTVARTVLRSGAQWLGVATVPEGIELRQAGIDVPILVMGAVNEPAEILATAYWQLQPTIVSPKQALIFSETLGADQSWRSSYSNLGSFLPVHLKLDTGMSRLGFPWEKAVEFAQFVQQLPHVQTASVYSHFATADSPDSSTMWKQHRRFEQAIADLTQSNLRPPSIHLANSAATLTDVSLHYDIVRVGLATYGLYPAPHLLSKVDLKPVLEVKARVTHLKNVAAGEGVSYGHRFVAPKDMRIAVVGIGYADGVPRLLSNQLTVAITTNASKHSSNDSAVDSETYLASQLGAITMDQMMLDASEIPHIQEGDVVTLLGSAGKHNLSADCWAQMSHTISWEILCGFKNRLPRITLNQPQLDKDSCEVSANI